MAQESVLNIEFIDFFVICLKIYLGKINVCLTSVKGRKTK